MDGSPIAPGLMDISSVLRYQSLHTSLSMKLYAPDDRLSISLSMP
jgi:hypothetical protein